MDFKHERRRAPVVREVGWLLVFNFAQILMTLAYLRLIQIEEPVWLRALIDVPLDPISLIMRILWSQQETEWGGEEETVIESLIPFILYSAAYVGVLLYYSCFSQDAQNPYTLRGQVMAYTAGLLIGVWLGSPVNDIFLVYTPAATSLSLWVSFLIQQHMERKSRRKLLLPTTRRVKTASCK